MTEQILPYYIGMILATSMATLAYLHATEDKHKRRSNRPRFSIRRIK